VSTQIQLTEEPYRGFVAGRGGFGVSRSEAVRRCVSDRLTREGDAPSREDRVRAAPAVCGKADPSGSSRVGIEHDRRLANAFRR
jgi:hypothetical protein